MEGGDLGADCHRAPADPAQRPRRGTVTAWPWLRAPCIRSSAPRVIVISAVSCSPWAFLGQGQALWCLGPGVPSQPLHCELCVLGPVMEPLWASVSFPTSWSTHSPCMVRLKRDVCWGDSKHEVSVWKGTEMPCPWEGARALALQGPRAPMAGKGPWSDPGPEGDFAGQGCSMEPEAPSRAPSGQPPLWPFPAGYRGIQRSGPRALPLLTAFVQASFWKGSQQ